MDSLPDRSVHWGGGVGLIWGRFLAAPSSYIKLVRAVYKQRLYYYLIQFSGMLHCWLQRYHARVRTLGSSLVYHFQTLPFTFPKMLAVYKM